MANQHSSRRHPQTRDSILEHSTRRRLAKIKNKRATTFIGEIFTGASGKDPLVRIAENPSMPPAILEQLAYHPDSAVREAVADNVNTPLDTLFILVDDDNADVRYAMAENHNLPLEILSMLGKDGNPYVAERAHATMRRLLPSIIEGSYWAHPGQESAAV
jgi:hypothetical protein